jgi:hypothetical protein
MQIFPFCKLKLRQSDVRVPLKGGFGRSPISFDTETRAIVMVMTAPVVVRAGIPVS